MSRFPAGSRAARCVVAFAAASALGCGGNVVVDGDAASGTGGRGSPSSTNGGLGGAVAVGSVGGVGGSGAIVSSGVGGFGGTSTVTTTNAATTNGVTTNGATTDAATTNAASSSSGSGGALCSQPPPAANARFVSDPPPTVTAIGSLRKELNGYPQYGASDHAADVLYDGETASWTFDVPADVRLVQLTISIVADDHAAVPIDQFQAALWRGDGVCVAIPSIELKHGRPFGGPFNDWIQISTVIQGAMPGETLRVTLSNQSTTSDPLDWIAVDWLELELERP